MFEFVILCFAAVFAALIVIGIFLGLVNVVGGFVLLGVFIRAATRPKEEDDNRWQLGGKYGPKLLDEKNPQTNNESLVVQPAPKFADKFAERKAYLDAVAAAAEWEARDN